MIRAGFAVRVRVVGAAQLSDPIGLSAELKLQTGSRSIHLDVAFESIPTSRLAVLDIPRYVAAGYSPLHVTERQLHDTTLGTVPYIWLTVTASSIYGLPQAIEADFSANPKLGTKRVDELLHSSVYRDLASVACIVANSFAVRFNSHVFSPESEHVLYWATADKTEALGVGAHGEALDVGPLVKEEITSALFTAVAAASVTGTASEAVERALHHYVKARLELPWSLERFLGTVMAIEALMATVDTRTSPEFAADAASLRALVSDTGPALTQFVNRLLDRQPSLNSRFDSLATFLSLPTQPADKILFRKLNTLRGQFAHGRPHDPEGPDESTIAHEADSLALRYISAFLARLREEAVAKGALRPAME